MAKIELQLGKKTHEETVYFSDNTESNFLSRGACKALHIIHAGFSTEQVSSVQLDGIASGQSPMRKKSVKSGCGQNPIKIDGDDSACGQNPMDFYDVNLASGQNPMRQKNGKLASGQNPMWKKSVKSGCGQNPMKMDSDNSVCGQNPMDKDAVKSASGQNPIQDGPCYKQLKAIVEEFSEVFDKDTLPPMDTEPMVIKLRENYVAKAITVPRKVPYARRDEEIRDIRKLESYGIIGRSCNRILQSDNLPN